MEPALFWAAAAQAALTLALGGAMGAMRYVAVRSRAVHVRDIALGQQNWPKRVQQVSSCYANQFESPLLFFAGVIVATLLNADNDLVMALAWAFVATRFAHATIYITANVILFRFLVFGTGLIILFALWTVLALDVAGWI